MQVECQETRLELLPDNVFRAVVVRSKAWEVFSVYERPPSRFHWMIRIYVDAFSPLGFCGECGEWFYGDH